MSKNEVTFELIRFTSPLNRLLLKFLAIAEEPFDVVSRVFYDRGHRLYDRSPRHSQVISNPEKTPQRKLSVEKIPHLVVKNSTSSDYTYKDDKSPVETLTLNYELRDATVDISYTRDGVAKIPGTFEDVQE